MTMVRRGIDIVVCDEGTPEYRVVVCDEGTPGYTRRVVWYAEGISRHDGIYSMRYESLYYAVTNTSL